MRLSAIAALLAFGCGNDDKSALRASIDENLTLVDSVGRPPIVVVVVENCDPPLKLEIVAGDASLFVESDAELLRFDGASAPDGELRAVAELDKLDPARYGLPATARVSARVDCKNGSVSTSTTELRFVPTADIVVPPAHPDRFWASDVTGDLLLCRDSELDVLVGGLEVTRSLDLEFPCALAEVEGSPGERRYLWSPRSGIAALNADATLAWTRPGLVEAIWSDPIRDPLILLDDISTGRRLFAVSRADGRDTVGPLAPTEGRTFLNALARAPDDTILVLESARENSPPSLTYYVRRIDGATGVDIDEIEAVRYPWNAPPDLASFSHDGTKIFVKAADNATADPRIEAVDLQTAARTALTTSNDPWRFPLGEVFGRLLVASEDAFRWLDPNTGAFLSEPFSPDSGNSFFRLRVESDGSIAMLADPSTSVARGLYIFDPSGASTLRFTSARVSFGWLTAGWDDTSLISLFDEVHILPSRRIFDDLAAAN